MRKIIGCVVTLVAMLAIPAMASAHSGSVVCNSSGVVFTYNANFATAKDATEVVNGTSYSFHVLPHVVNTHTIPGVTGTVVASSSWGGPGSIPEVTLTCPAPPTPPVVVNCPEGTTDLGMSGGVKLCETVKTVINTVVIPGPPPTPGTCPKNQKQLTFKDGVLTCQKTVTHIKTHTKVITKTRWVEWCPKPPKCKNPSGCVAG